MNSLLQPPLAIDPAFQALDLINQRISTLPLNCLFVWDIDHVDVSALAFVADQFSLTDEMCWSLATTEAQQRALIKQSIEIHAHKGSPWAVQQLCYLLGFGDVTIIEGLSNWVYDGTVTFDGSHTFGDSAGWAKYMLVMPSPISNEIGHLLYQALLKVAPARCHLSIMDYRSVMFPFNGTWQFDGSYNFGEIGFDL